MRSITSGLLLVVLSGLCGAVHAYEAGDFAPRGSLLYTRVADFSESLGKLGGKDWQAHADAMLLGRSLRDVEDSQPVIEEIRRFVDHMGTTEFMIGDIMIREPYIQSATVVQLKEGAPTAFSKEFTDLVKKESRDAEITEDSLRFESVRIWLKPGLLIITTGGMMETHVQDVIDGFNDESLSQVERFNKWSGSAKGDMVLFADMRAWRAAVDRLGEDFDDDVRDALATVEWQKWDLITGSATLGNGVSLDLNLSLNQPFEKLGAWMKPAGGSRLSGILPRDTVGFLSVQLGQDHERTYLELLRSIHAFEQDARPGRLRQDIRWAEYEVEWAEENLERLKTLKAERDKNEDKDKDKDAVPDAEPQGASPPPVRAKPKYREEGDVQTLEEQITEAEAELERAKEYVKSLQAELAALTSRAFEPDREARGGRRSSAEEIHDEIGEMFSELGLTREDVLSAIGNEWLSGIMNLPDPLVMRSDPFRNYQEMWFSVVETNENFPGVKEKLLDYLLARSLPEDMPEEAREEAKARGESMVLKAVEGGEILRAKGLTGSGMCAFIGQGFVGVAANEEVARRILKASVSSDRLAIPGGSIAGSKVMFIDLHAILTRSMQGELNRSREWKRPMEPYFDLVKHLTGGLQIVVSSDEGSHGVRFTATSYGERNMDNALRMFTGAIHDNKALEHDQYGVLDELTDGIDSWLRDNLAKLDAAEATERARMIKAVTLESLIADGHFKPSDGMRSAFDPAMAERFKAMLESYGKLLGPAKGSEAPATDLSESSFEWIGLPTHLRAEDDSDYRGRGMGFGPGTPWIVCVMKGDWVHGGRLAVVWDSRARVVWMHADDLARLRAAIADGKPYRDQVVPDSEIPRWKAMSLLQQRRWDLNEAAWKVRAAREAAKTEGRDFRPEFNGADHEDPMAALRKLLDIGEEEWFHLEDAGNISIKTTPEGKTTIRISKYGQWLEVDEDMNTKSSFDDE